MNVVNLQHADIIYTRVNYCIVLLVCFCCVRIAIGLHILDKTHEVRSHKSLCIYRKESNIIGR